MAKRIQEKELRLAAKLAARKSGVTRRQLATRLSVTPERAKGVLAKVMSPNEGWLTYPLGTGKDNRTLVYYTGEGAVKAKQSREKRAAKLQAAAKRVAAKKKAAKKKVAKKATRKKAPTKSRKTAKKAKRKLAGASA